MRCATPASCTSAASAKYANLSTAGTPAPRSIRAGKVSHSALAPVALAMRTAAARPGFRVASPPSRMTVGAPDRSAASAARMRSSSTPGATPSGAAGAGFAPPVHDTSAGRINVETVPPRQALTASAASTPTSPVVTVRRTHPDTVPATASMSDSNGAS